MGKKTQKKKLIFIVSLVVLLLLFAVIIIQSIRIKASADVTGCAFFSSPAPGWCADGEIVSSVPDSNGCVQPPKCVIKNYTFSVKHGFNSIVLPREMFEDSNQIDTAPFTDAGMTIYQFNRGEWQINIKIFSLNYTYLVYNPRETREIKIGNEIEKFLVGGYFGEHLQPGWNLIANSFNQEMNLNELSYHTYVQKPGCKTIGFCDEIVSLSRLLNDQRAHKTIYQVGDLNSSNPYKTITTTGQDLSTIKIPPRTGFWVYLFN